MKLGEPEGLIRPASVRQRMPDLALLQRIGPSHHMNCVYEKLRRDPSFLLALAEAEQSDAWNDHDRGVGVAELRRIWGCPGLVILLVFGAISGDLLLNLGLELVQIAAGRVPVDKQRTDLSPEKMIRTTRSERGKFFGPFAAGETERVFIVGIMRDDTPVM